MNSNKSKKLEQIANGFNAARKIQTVQSSSYRSDDSRSSGKGRADTMNDILHVLAEFSPDRYRDSLSTSLERTALYTDTYKNVRQHITQSRSHKMMSDDLIGLIRILKPVVRGKSQNNFEKLLRIYEILKS